MDTKYLKPEKAERVEDDQKNDQKKEMVSSIIVAVNPTINNHFKHQWFKYTRVDQKTKHNVMSSIRTHLVTCGKGFLGKQSTPHLPIIKLCQMMRAPLYILRRQRLETVGP